MKSKRKDVERFFQEHPNKKYTCKEIAERLEVTKATVSKWVRILNAEGKIKIDSEEDHHNMIVAWRGDDG